MSLFVRDFHIYTLSLPRECKVRELGGWEGVCSCGPSLGVEDCMG